MKWPNVGCRGGCGRLLYVPHLDGLCLDCTHACIRWHELRGRLGLNLGVVDPVAVDEWLTETGGTPPAPVAEEWTDAP